MRNHKNTAAAATTAIETTATSTEITMPLPPTPKQPTSFSITLTAPGQRLVLLAVRKADGSAMTTVTTIDAATKKSQRGVTAHHVNFELAKGAVRKQADAAQKLGWLHRPAGRIFAAKPDAFSTIPAPTTATATKVKR